VCRFANELLTAGLQQKDTNRTRSAIADALANMVAGLSKKTVTESAFWDGLGDHHCLVAGASSVTGSVWLCGDSDQEIGPEGVDNEPG
jgi:hypothetical protein